MDDLIFVLDIIKINFVSNLVTHEPNFVNDFEWAGPFRGEFSSASLHSR